MKSKESNWWIVLVLFSLFVFCSYFLVEQFKISNGQFRRDATHIYTDRVCSGVRTSYMCTNYFFTEKQHKINEIVDLLYKILLVIFIVITSIIKIFYPSEKDLAYEQAKRDPVATAQSAWSELMKENEKQRNDPYNGFGVTSSGVKKFFGLALLLICFVIIGMYIDTHFETYYWLQSILRIN